MVELAFEDPHDKNLPRFWRSPYLDHAPLWVDLNELARSLIRAEENISAVAAHAASPVVQFGNAFIRGADELYLISQAECFAFAVRASGYARDENPLVSTWFSISLEAHLEYMRSFKITSDIMQENWEDELVENWVKARLGEDLNVQKLAKKQVMNLLSAASEELNI